jgi:CRP-like cAMP-binding protein
VIRFIGPGEMFGTVALFTNRQYPADATTLSNSLKISWSETDLLALLRRHPQIALNVIRIIGKRLKEAQERMRELATQRAEQRVAHAVLRLAQQAGHGTVDGTRDALEVLLEEVEHQEVLLREYVMGVGYH